MDELPRTLEIDLSTHRVRLESEDEGKLTITIEKRPVYDTGPPFLLDSVNVGSE